MASDNTIIELLSVGPDRRPDALRAGVGELDAFAEQGVEFGDDVGAESSICNNTAEGDR